MSIDTKAGEEFERERIVRIIKGWLRHYPKSIFPDSSQSPDAHAARGIRMALRGILKDIRESEES